MTDYEKLSREHFDSMAENYAATDGTYYSRLPKAASDEAAAILRRIGFGSLLDVGCGSGYLISVLAAERKDAEFYGLDISPKMLEQARKKLAAVRNVTLTEGGANRLPYPDGSFDAVTCIMSFHHYPYPYEAVAEACRVLRAGGTYVLSDVDKHGYGEPEAGEYATYDADSAAEILRRTGFAVTEKRNISPESYIVVGVKEG